MKKRLIFMNIFKKNYYNKSSETTTTITILSGGVYIDKRLFSLFLKGLNVVII